MSVKLTPTQLAEIETRAATIAMIGARLAIDKILQDVAELPDRTSPDDQPDMMLVTTDELDLIVGQHLDGALTVVRAEVIALLADRRALVAENDRLKSACSTLNDEVMQILGRALGYPKFVDDQVTFPGATDADGICPGDMVAEAMAEQAAARIRELVADLAQAQECAGAWHQTLDAICAILELPPASPDTPAEVRAKFEALTAKVYLPGQWGCPKCGFRLTQRTLHAADGSVSTRDQTGERCRNCDVPLWRVAALDEVNEAYQQANRAFDMRQEAIARAEKAEAERDALKAERERLRDGTNAARDVLAERRRQVDAEGWTPEHDDEHADGQMADAAGYYALYAGSDDYHRAAMAMRAHGMAPSGWPWGPEWFKPAEGRRRMLVKAGALIIAEIERLDRAAARGGASHDD